MPSLTCTSTLETPVPDAVPTIDLSSGGPAPFSGVLIVAVRVLAGRTVNVKPRTASGGMPLVAVMMSGYVPAVPVAGVPLIAPVTASKVKPVGSVPDNEKTGAGQPEEVIGKASKAPIVKVWVVEPVRRGKSSLVSVL